MSGFELGPVQSFIDVLLRHGIRFVVCPGSRSSPLVQALLARKAPMDSVVDERSAGYQALGMAQALGTPVAVVTTSGTAAANLLPAMCEAYFARVPILALTADRPAEWIGQEDNQAIFQRGLFHRHVLAEFETPVDVQHPDARWHMERVARDALRMCEHRGPVHVNMPFREPLYVDERLDLPPLAPETPPRVIATSPRYDEDDGSLGRAARPLLLAGQSEVGGINVLPYGERLPVTGELLANLPGSVAPELWISDESVLPDLVITAGGPFVSKFVRRAMRRSGAPHWHLGEFRGAEPFQRAVRRLDPRWLESVRASGYQEKFALAVARGRARRDAWLHDHADGEIACIRAMLDAAKPGMTIHLGNSLIVRIACLVGEGKPGVRYHSNRGTSGIDGSLSTAVGHALARPESQHVALLGDLSFFYDRNALWREAWPSNLRVVVVNNGGGAIFNALEGPGTWGDDTKWWTTPHQLSARSTAESHGLVYEEAGQVGEVIRWMGQAAGPSLLEICTDREQTAAEFRDLLATLAQPHGSTSP